MEVWLYDIVSGYQACYRLRDNQRYSIENDQIRNQTNIYYGTYKLHTVLKRNYLNNDKVFDFLKDVENIVNSHLQDPKILLFHEKEYEHNTDQKFIKIEGNRWNNFKLETGNIIGHLKYHDYQINISSRFGDLFVKYIIADADGFLEINNLGGISNNESNYWLLQYYWIVKIKKAFRLGLPKVYAKQTVIDSKVKGKIDITYFELNKSIGAFKSTSRNHSYVCSQNALIVEAFKKINKDFMSNDLFSIKQAFNVASQGHKMSQAELLRVKPFSNPYYSDYNEVLALSKILLKNGALDIGANSEINGFLFDVSMLFEYFIRKQFKRNGFTIQAKNDKSFKIPTGTHFIRSLYPDLIATYKGKTFLFDVKYKSFDERFGVKREDLFQIYTYLGQVGNVIHVDYLGFIYPTNNETKASLQKQKVNVLGKEFLFLIAFLYIPNETEDFNNEFSKSIMNFFDNLKNIKTN